MKKQYPSSGDSGKSKLFTGELAGKNHFLFEAMGTLDELNSVVGWVRCVCEERKLDSQLRRIQESLFEAGGVIGKWSGRDISGDIIGELEEQISEMHRLMPKFNGFILPGGTELSSRLHIARTIARRAERKISAVCSDESERRKFINALRFINRLSDWFYVAACYVNASAGVTETRWQSKDVEK